MRRRTFLLLYYLVRSPFYDRYSEWVCFESHFQSMRVPQFCALIIWNDRKLKRSTFWYTYQKNEAKVHSKSGLKKVHLARSLCNSCKQTIKTTQICSLIKCILVCRLLQTTFASPTCFAVENQSENGKIWNWFATVPLLIFAIGVCPCISYGIFTSARHANLSFATVLDERKVACCLKLNTVESNSFPLRAGKRFSSCCDFWPSTFLELAW